MIKNCVICGGEFKASPSDKKSTCSPACRSERARRHASKGRPLGDKARERRSKQLAGKSSKSLQAATRAARENAIGDPSSFHGAKDWVAVDPEGRVRQIRNLQRTLINEYGEAEGRRISGVLRRMASAMRKGEPAWWTQCGWTLLGVPAAKSAEVGTR